MTIKLALFGSGEGTSIEFVLQSIQSNLLRNTKYKVTHLVTNTSSNIVNIVNNYDVNTLVLDNPAPFNSVEERLHFESKYKYFWGNDGIPDVILLLGWKYILSEDLITHFNNHDIQVLNMHPALPNTFVGNHCAKKTFDSYLNGTTKVAGSMIHKCTPDLDKGEVIDTVKFNIDAKTFDEFSQQVKFHERILLYNVISNLTVNKLTPEYIGKVRNVTEIGHNLLVLTATDRISAFDRHLTNVPQKGILLNYMSAWWFNKTRHIIPNHYVHHDNRHMVVKKCNPIKLEIVVRAFMTGSSSTSIWTRYNSGERNMYGIQFRDGYSKNQKLDELVITPTTKGDVDEPITKQDLKDRGYLTETEINYIYEKALELFKFGSLVAADRGLLLVDTKYEFGFYNNQIILMDELHTCDSSRYWKHESYSSRFANALEPEKYDKDCIRDYVKATYSNQEIQTRNCFDIPENIVENVNNVYKTYYNLLTNSNLDTAEIGLKQFVENYFNYTHRQLAVIIAGSVSDRKHVEHIQMELKNKSIYSIAYYKSAHKNTLDVMEIIDKYNTYENRNIVFVTVAGRSNALSGVVASNTRYPVIGCPPFKDTLDCMTNINSTLQCPSNVPVLACLEPVNVALAVSNMFLFSTDR
jgi:phosphoribosylaminoimidazole-succinocarboxamide synthase